MKWKLYIWFENLWGRILFSTFYTLLLFPWVTVLIELFSGQRLENNSIWFFGMAMFSGGIILRLTEEVENNTFSGFLTLSGLFGFDLLFCKLTGASVNPIEGIPISPFFICFIAMGIFEIVGFGFEKIPTRKTSFVSGFTFGTASMAITMLLKESCQLFLTVNHILIFFLSGAMLLIYSIYQEVKEGISQKQGAWMGVSLTAVLLITIFSSIFAFGLNKRTLVKLLSPIIIIADIIYEVVTHAFLLILILLEPIFQLLMAIIAKIMKSVEKNEIPEEWAQNLQTLDGRELYNTVTTDFSWLIKPLLMVLFILVVIFFIRRYRGLKKKDLGYEEIRESIFDPLDIKNDFLKMFNSLKGRFLTRTNPKIYSGTSPVIKIREVYYNFLRTFYQTLPFQKYYTPNEYMLMMNKKYPKFSSSVKKITRTYEQARYGSEVGSEELQEITEAFNQIMITKSTDKEKK